MAKKLKKAKRQMSLRTRNTIINSFKGVISNQACVDNAKEAPWWLAILFFLFGLIIPLIPNYVSLGNAYGSSFLNSGSYGFAEKMTKATYKMHEDKVKLVVSDATLFCYNNSETAVEPFKVEEIYSDTDANTGEYTFKAYYINAYGNSLTNLISTIQSTYYVRNSTTVYDIENYPDVTNRPYIYIPSFVVFAPYTMGLCMYKSVIPVLDNPNGYNLGTFEVACTSLGGARWNEMPDGDILELASKYYVDYDHFDPNKMDIQSIHYVYSYWKGVFNVTYEHEASARKWNTTLIYLGVYGGLMIFLGLMVFVLTRGKDNPYRVLNLWVTQKVSYFLSFTPALLALIVGFIFGTNMIGQMAFIMLLSLRVMWASMRTLRPVQ